MSEPANLTPLRMTLLLSAFVCYVFWAVSARAYEHHLMLLQYQAAVEAGEVEVNGQGQVIENGVPSIRFKRVHRIAASGAATSAIIASLWHTFCNSIDQLPSLFSVLGYVITKRLWIVIGFGVVLSGAIGFGVIISKVEASLAQNKLPGRKGTRKSQKRKMVTPKPVDY